MLWNGIFQTQCFLLKPEQLVTDYPDKDSHKIDPLISETPENSWGIQGDLQKFQWYLGEKSHIKQSMRL